MTKTPTSSPKYGGWIGLAVFAAVFYWHWPIALYFAPTIVAASRGHRHPGIVFVTNVLFGWTPAWLLVMLYSLEKPHRPAMSSRLFGTTPVRFKYKVQVKEKVINF